MAHGFGKSTLKTIVPLPPLYAQSKNGGTDIPKQHVRSKSKDTTPLPHENTNSRTTSHGRGKYMQRPEVVPF